MKRYCILILIVSAFSSVDATGSLRTEYLLSNMQIMERESLEGGLLPMGGGTGGDSPDFLGPGVPVDPINPIDDNRVITLMKRDYCGNHIYRNDSLERVMNDYGYRNAAGYHYFVKDYQGNVRAVVDCGGTLEEVNSYYPYGALMGGGIAAGVQPYKYGGKELDRQAGIDWYDSQARWYDPLIGRTPTQDRMAEKYYSISPYAWCAGNPINNIDMNGDTTILYATTLPGLKEFFDNSITRQATHTFIAVQDEDNYWHNFAYGSEYYGIKGVFGGQLKKINYKDDIDIMNGLKQDHVKAKIIIEPPINKDGNHLSMKEFDKKIIEIANSFGNNPRISYFMTPLKKTHGNCNTSTSTILHKAGISDSYINEIRNSVPGLLNGFGQYRPWTASEQRKAVQEEEQKINSLIENFNTKWWQPIK